MRPTLRTAYLEQIFDIFSDILGCHIDFTSVTGNSIASSAYIRKSEEDNPRPVPFGGLVTQRVVENPTTLVLDRRFTAHAEPCTSCSRRHNCEIKMEVVSPIVVDQEIKGVLAFAAYNGLEADWLASQLDIFKAVNISLAGAITCFLTTAEGFGELVLPRRGSSGLPSLEADFIPAISTCPFLRQSTSDPFGRILGISPELLQAKDRAAKIAESEENALIVGETGTGKELFARAIHDSSKRNAGPFIAINCAAIPDSLLESELFGYCAGAFTGASAHGQKGKVEAASGGTLFLDEIGEMSHHLQAKILRFIEGKTVHRIGEAVERQVDVRIIGATNHSFADLVTGKTFRIDLFYRLAVHYLELPPLRERKDDIRFLADALFEKAGNSYESLSPLAEKIISTYDWPGNVRELKNCILYSTNLAAGRMIKTEHLPPWIVKKAESGTTTLLGLEANGGVSHLSVLQSAEAKQILQALDKYGCSATGKRDAARHLDISLSTLYRKIKLYNIGRE